MEVDPYALVGIAISVGCIAIEHFHYQAELRERITKLETKIDLFWDALGERLPDMLLKGNPIEEGTRLFELLEKQKDKTIDVQETCELIKLISIEMREKEHTAAEEVALLLLSTALKVKVIK